MALNFCDSKVLSIIIRIILPGLLQQVLDSIADFCRRILVVITLKFCMSEMQSIVIKITSHGKFSKFLIQLRISVRRARRATYDDSSNFGICDRFQHNDIIMHPQVLE